MLAEKLSLSVHGSGESGESWPSIQSILELGGGPDLISLNLNPATSEGTGDKEVVMCKQGEMGQ